MSRATPGYLHLPRLEIARRSICQRVAKEVGPEIADGLDLAALPGRVRAMARRRPTTPLDPARLPKTRPSRFRRAVEGWVIEDLAAALEDSIARGMPREEALGVVARGGWWDDGLLGDCIVDVGAILAGMYFENAARCEVEATVALAKEAAR